MSSIDDAQRVQFYYARSEVKDDLFKRAPAPGLTISEAAHRDLARYYALLTASLPRFPEREALLLIDSLSEWDWDVSSASLLWARVEETIRAEGLDQKWGVGGPDLIARLKDLTLLECVALCDTVDRFWLAKDRHPDANNEGIAQQVGLCYAPVATRRL